MKYPRRQERLERRRTDAEKTQVQLNKGAHKGIRGRRTPGSLNK